jgi:hypothetical protein
VPWFTSCFSLGDKWPYLFLQPATHLARPCKILAPRIQPLACRVAVCCRRTSACSAPKVAARNWRTMPPATWRRSPPVPLWAPQRCKAASWAVTSRQPLWRQVGNAPQIPNSPTPRRRARQVGAPVLVFTSLGLPNSCTSKDALTLPSFSCLRS